MRDLSIIVVGCGGTGTFFLKELCRALSGDEDTKVKRILIVDGDTVEKKNLLRQAFSLEDIGENKAKVFADILTDAFDLRFPVSYLDRYIETEQDLPDEHSDVLLIGCSDNGACRKVMDDYFLSPKRGNVWYYDAGNSFLEGQVIYAVKEYGKIVSPPGSFYGSYAEEKPRSEMSCEELNNVAPQHILANMQAAALLLYGALELIQKGNKVKGITVFSVEQGLMGHEEPENYGFDPVDAKGYVKSLKEKRENDNVGKAV